MCLFSNIFHQATSWNHIRLLLIITILACRIACCWPHQISVPNDQIINWTKWLRVKRCFSDEGDVCRGVGDCNTPVSLRFSCHFGKATISLLRQQSLFHSNLKSIGRVLLIILVWCIMWALWLHCFAIEIRRLAVLWITHHSYGANVQIIC